MAGTLGRIYGVLWSASGATCMGLLQGNAGTNITQASLSSITYTVRRNDNAGTETLTGSGSLTVSAVVFDTPQLNDPRYAPTGGFNFAAVIPASCFAVADRDHKIDIVFVPVTGEQFKQGWGGKPL